MKLERPWSLFITDAELVRFYAPIQRRWYWLDRALVEFRTRKSDHRKKLRREAHERTVKAAKQRRAQADARHRDRVEEQRRQRLLRR